MSSESVQSSSPIAGKKTIVLKNGKEISVYDRKAVKKDKPVVFYKGAIHKTQVTPEQISSALKMKFSLLNYTILDSKGQILDPLTEFKNDTNYWHFFINEAGEVLKKRIGNFSINPKTSFSSTNPIEFKKFSDNYKKLKGIKRKTFKDLRQKDLNSLEKRCEALEKKCEAIIAHQKKMETYLIQMNQRMTKYGI